MKQKAPIKVIIFGATGTTGQFLVRYGLELGYPVSVFVRDEYKLKAILGEATFSKLQVFTGDALDEAAVEKAMAGHHAAVNVAAPKDSAAVFEKICKNIVGAAQKSLEKPKRLWLFGGLPGLDVPHTKTIGSDLIGMRPILKSHKLNYSLLKNSKDLDWSFMCPGPMFLDDDSQSKKELKISTEEMPYEISRTSRFFPKFAHPFIMLKNMNEMIVSYQDVAKLVIKNLEADGPYSKKRVGVAYRK